MGVLTLAGKPINWAKPPAATTRVMWSTKDMYGRKVTGSFRTICALDHANTMAKKRFGKGLVVIQPPFNTGVSQSAGTHDYDACLDVYIPGVDWWTQQRFFRELGWGAYYRRPPQFSAHIHMFALPPREGRDVTDDYRIFGFKVGKFVDGGWSLYGKKKFSAQIGDYYAHRNALANHAKDPSWFPADITKTIFSLPTYVKAQQVITRKPATLGIVGFNVPAPGVGSGKDLGNDAARVKAAAALVKSGVHVAGWNELGRRLAEGKPSVFAASLLKALGSSWTMITPKGSTGVWNENYATYRNDRLELVIQYNDSILEAGSGNRHITRIVFKHKATGLIFALGVMHLVNGKTATNEKDRQKQAGDALTSMLAVTAKHGDCPFVIVGDMNTVKDLTAFTKAGMKRSRKWADKSIGATATYTNYEKEVPSTNAADWELDHAYFSKHWYVLTYKLLRKLSKGKYVKPRPSDHDATHSTARV